MKVMVVKDRNVLLDEYLNKIESYEKHILTDIQNFDTWKIS